jgi:hypothetical protein
MPRRRRAPLPLLVGCNFFLFAAVAQVVYVPLLLSRPDRTMLLLGIAGNLAIVLLYLIIHIPGGEGSSAIKAPYRSRMEAPREARRINVQAVSERRRVYQDVFSMLNSEQVQLDGLWGCLSSGEVTV